jgi:hypothetical protein
LVCLLFFLKRKLLRCKWKLRRFGQTRPPTTMPPPTATPEYHPGLPPPLAAKTPSGIEPATCPWNLNHYLTACPTRIPRSLRLPDFPTAGVWRPIILRTDQLYI